MAQSLLATPQAAFHRSFFLGSTIPIITPTQRLTANSKIAPTDIITNRVNPRFNAPAALARTHVVSEPLSHAHPGSHGRGGDE